VFGKYCTVIYIYIYNNNNNNNINEASRDTYILVFVGYDVEVVKEVSIHRGR
jgi:hypothetical protein